jgi:two-component system NtrC family sensor kinase
MQMFDWLGTVLSSSEFMPHGHCYLWMPALVWSHVISDALIALAYTTIPFTLVVYFIHKRRDLPFSGMFVCFGVFIIACGAGHAMEIWTLRTPDYWLSGFVKAITAVSSVLTAVILIRLIPRALVIPSPAALRAANSELRAALSEREALVKLLEREMRQRERVEVELRLAHKLESVGRLASGVAHEINTPVHFVHDSVQFIRDSFTDIAVMMGKYGELRRSLLATAPATAGLAEIAQAEEETDLAYLLANLPPAFERSMDGLGRITTIVRSMKDFAHPDRKETTDVDLNQSVRTTLVVASHEYKYLADVETDLGELPPIRCHGGEINQVLLNLIVNAAHAIEDVIKGTAQRGVIKVRTRQDGNTVVLSVSDNGTGVPDEVRDKIFDNSSPPRRSDAAPVRDSACPARWCATGTAAI